MDGAIAEVGKLFGMSDGPLGAVAAAVAVIGTGCGEAAAQRFREG